MVYVLPTSTAIHVLSVPWPEAIPHPVPLDKQHRLWLSVVPESAQIGLYHDAWSEAGYSGLVYLQSMRRWRAYLAGASIPSHTTLAAAAAEVGLPDGASLCGMRLAAGLQRLASLVTHLCWRYDTWRLARRAARVLTAVR